MSIVHLMPSRRFPARFDILQSLCAFVRQGAERAGFDQRDAYAVELAVDEACTNIIEHGYGGESQGEILASWKVRGDDLVIELQDWGKPFDPTKVPPPDFQVPLQELPMRGAGLLMIRRAMDELEYEKTENGANLLRMIKRLPAARHSSDQRQKD